MKTKIIILFLLLTVGASLETKAQNVSSDTITGANTPELDWDIIGNPIIIDDIGQRDLTALPEATQEDGALCFTSPIAISLPYYIYKGNTFVESGTLTLVPQEKETINIKHLPSGTYLFVLNFGNICYGCRFEVE